MPNSLTPRYLGGLTFSTAHMNTLMRLGEHLGRERLYLAQQPTELEHLRQAAIVASTVSSNRLEGIEVAPSRVAALLQRNANPRDRNEQEVAGYRGVLDLIHESHEHMALSPSVMLQLHKLLYRYHPYEGGRFKPTDNTIIEQTPEGHQRVRFRPTPAVATPGAIDTLCRLHEQARVTHPDLITLPLLILDFLCVHPFADGNGRISRLLTLLELYKAGHRVGRYVSIEQVIESTKQGYYDALEASSQGWHEGAHDVLPWLTYFWGVLLAVYADFESRVDEVTASHGNKADSVELVALSMDAPFTLSELAERLPHVSRATINRRLGKLRDQGRLHLSGKGRGAKWTPVD